MSKMTGCEKFFVSMIGEGLDRLSDSISIDDIEYLYENSLDIDDNFNKRIRASLKEAFKYCDKDKVEENVIKLCKGRETRLREIVVMWYSKEVKPSFWDTIKNIISGKM